MTVLVEVVLCKQLMVMDCPTTTDVADTVAPVMVRSGIVDDTGNEIVRTVVLLDSDVSFTADCASARSRIYFVPLPAGIINVMDSFSAATPLPSVDASVPMIMSSDDQTASLEYRYSSTGKIALPEAGFTCCVAKMVMV